MKSLRCSSIKLQVSARLQLQGGIKALIIQLQRDPNPKPLLNPNLEAPTSETSQKPLTSNLYIYAELS